MMGLLFKRALYRELRSSVGYYDARRIVRRIEGAGEINDVEEIGRVLREAGFDERQIASTLEAAERSPPPAEVGDRLNRRKSLYQLPQRSVCRAAVAQPGRALG